MNKVACAALLLAVSMKAQNNSPAQTPEPPAPEVTPQSTPPPTPPIEQRSGDEVRTKLQELGYFDAAPSRVGTESPAVHCAIPLQSIPVEKDRFAILNVPAGPLIDPKIVQAPALPSCSKAEKSPVIERRIFREKK